MEYRIIDADSHVNEPAETWQDRVPSKLKDRAPKMVEQDGGWLAWSFDNGKRVMPIGTACAGVSELEYDIRGTTFERMRPASYDPHARLEEMEADMVQAQVLYPSVALTGANNYTEDPELQLACVQAYNDWLHDFCQVNPDRLLGLALGPMTGIDDLLGEWHRVASRGARGIIIGTYPNGSTEPSPEDDRFWSELQEWEFPVHIHFGFSSGGAFRGSKAPTGLNFATGAFLSRLGMNIFKPMADLVYSGLFEQFPKLKIVAVETGIGWIPYYLECLDESFLRQRFRTGMHLKRMPSDYFKEHIWATFVTDPHGLESRHAFGVDHIMWSTDYPHSQSDWPYSQRIVAYEFRHIPPDERRMILRDNAASLYKLG